MVERLFRTIDVTEPTTSFDQIIPAAASVIAGGQVQSAALADGYFLQLGGLELGETIESADLLEDNAGRTADGRTIEELLTASRAAMLTALKDGKGVPTALRKGLFGFRRAARHEVLDAGARELLHQVASSDKTKGWRSRSKGTCSACLSVDDGGLNQTTPGGGPTPPFHPECNCVPEPAFKVTEVVRRPTGQERFEDLSMTQQDEALGPVRASLLRNSIIDWVDVSIVQTFTEWTPVLTDAPLSRLLAIAGMTAEEVLALESRAT